MTCSMLSLNFFFWRVPEPPCALETTAIRKCRIHMIQIFSHLSSHWQWKNSAKLTPNNQTFAWALASHQTTVSSGTENWAVERPWLSPRETTRRWHDKSAPTRQPHPEPLQHWMRPRLSQNTFSQQRWRLHAGRECTIKFTSRWSIISGKTGHENPKSIWILESFWSKSYSRFHIVARLDFFGFESWNIIKKKRMLYVYLHHCADSLTP